MRSLRTPALSVMVRSALGSVLPTVARGALSLQLKRSADVALHLCRKMRHSLANARHLVYGGIPPVTICRTLAEPDAPRQIRIAQSPVAFRFALSRCSS